MEKPFEFDIKRPTPERVEGTYRGHLGEHDLEAVRSMDAVLAEIPSSVGLYFDVSDMTGFHRSQVQVHGELFLRHRAKISGIALVGARPVIRFGAISVGLIARLQIRVFDEHREAVSWLGELRSRSSQVRPKV